MRIFAAAALAALCFALPASAQDYRTPPPPSEEGVGTDTIRFKPFARAYSYYTTNLFQEPNRRKEEDVGFELTAGADVRVGGETDYLSVGYSATQLLFVKNPKQNTVEHQARFNSEFNPSEIIKLSASGSANWLAQNTDPQFRGRVRNFAGFGTAAIEVRPLETVGFLVEGEVTHNFNYPRAFERLNTLTSRVGTFVILSPDLPGGLEVLVGSNWRQLHYVDHKATNPDYEFVSWQAGLRASNDLVTMDMRGGYEVSWVVKRRGFSRRFDNPEGFFGSMSVTVTPNQTSTITVFGTHAVSFSAASSSQRNTNLGINADQKIPGFEDLHVFAGATWSLQDARRATENRVQTYLLGVGYSPIDGLELGLQSNYMRTSSRSGGFETFETGVVVSYSL